MRKPFLSEVDKDFLRGLPLAGLLFLLVMVAGFPLRFDVSLFEAIGRVG